MYFILSPPIQSPKVLYVTTEWRISIRLHFLWFNFFILFFDFIFCLFVFLAFVSILDLTALILAPEAWFYTVITYLTYILNLEMPWLESKLNLNKGNLCILLCQVSSQVILRSAGFILRLKRWCMAMPELLGKSQNIVPN